MNRTERRALRAPMRAQAKACPAHLKAIPPSKWPDNWPGPLPRAVWRSREFLAQLYDAPPFIDREVRRLSINRVTMQSSGRWDAEISWDELMRIKRECGYGDWYGVEVFPCDHDIVNVANMRHLWLRQRPLSIGWVVAR